VVLAGGGVYWFSRPADVDLGPGPGNPSAPAAGGQATGAATANAAANSLGPSSVAVPIDGGGTEGAADAAARPTTGPATDDDGPTRRPRPQSAATRARIEALVGAGLSEREADDCLRAFRLAGRAETAEHNLLVALAPRLPDLLAKGQITLSRPGTTTAVVGARATFVAERKLLEVTIRRPGGDLVWSIPETVGDPELWQAVRGGK
jgi:hypothetical protein